MDEVEKRGGKSTGQVSGRTTHLLAGRNPGSKLEKAGELGVIVVTEQEFIKQPTKGKIGNLWDWATAIILAELLFIQIILTLFTWQRWVIFIRKTKSGVFTAAKMAVKRGKRFYT